MGDEDSDTEQIEITEIIRDQLEIIRLARGDDSIGDALRGLVEEEATRLKAEGEE